MKTSATKRAESGLRRKLKDSERTDLVHFIEGAKSAISKLRHLPALNSAALEEITHGLGPLSFGLSVLRSNLPDKPLRDAHAYRKMGMPEDLQGLGAWLSEHLYALVYRAQYARKGPGKGVPRDVRMACEVYARLRAPSRMPHVLGCYFDPQRAVALPRATAIDISILVVEAAGASATRNAIEQATRAGRSLRIAQSMTLQFGPSDNPVTVSWDVD